MGLHQAANATVDAIGPCRCRKPRLANPTVVCVVVALVCLKLTDFLPKSFGVKARRIFPSSRAQETAFHGNCNTGNRAACASARGRERFGSISAFYPWVAIFWALHLDVKVVVSVSARQIGSAWRYKDQKSAFSLLARHFCHSP